jgi:hypothetical protein
VNRPLEELFDELAGPARPLGPTDWPEPGQLRRRAEHRRTVRRASIASSVAVLAAVAIAVPATLAGRGSGTIAPSTHDTTKPAATHKAAAPVLPGVRATPTEQSTVGAPLTAGATPPAGRLQSFGTFSLTIPAGWDAKTGVDPEVAGPHDGHVCLQPQSTASYRSLYGCAGLDVYYGSSLPGEGTAAFQGNRANVASWHHATSLAICPQTAAQVQTGISVLAGPLTGPDQSLWAYPKVGNAAASYQIWHVACADGTSFNPQSWYLPDSKAVFFLYDQNAEAETVLGSIVTTRNAPASG